MVFTKENIAEELIEFRIKHKLTQTTISEKTDIDSTYLSKMENGNHKPTKITLARLNKLAGIYEGGSSNG